jgi:hypothetical protein
MDVKIVNLVRELRGLSIREVARRTGSVQPRNLASHFSGQSGKVSQEKLSSVYKVLDLSENGLVSGIHRWSIPSQTMSDMEKAEYLIRELCPGGVRVYPLRSANIVHNIVPASFGSFLPWMLWILTPIIPSEVRIVLSIKPSAKNLNMFLGSTREINLKYLGGVLPDGSSPDEIPSSAWIPLPPEIFDRIKSDPDLIVPDLDAILGISGSPDWTWERLMAVLQGKGMTPEEVARKCGVL